MTLALLLFPIGCFAQINYKGDRQFFYCAEYCTFSGFYLGGNIGWAWGLYHTSFESPGFVTPSVSPEYAFTTNKNTITGGGQAGFNYHHNHLLAGFEVDYNTLRIGNEQVVPITFVSAVFNPGDSLSVNNSAEVSYRARVGYVLNNWLFYGTLGFTQMNVNVDAILVAVGETSDKTTLLGGTAGIGTEYAISRYWSVGLEYRFTRYAGKNLDLETLGSEAVGFSPFKATVSDFDINQVFAKVNFRIG
jgi:outer membrane immunogenic protein